MHDFTHSDRAYADEELPAEFRLYVPLAPK